MPESNIQELASSFKDEYEWSSDNYAENET